MLPGILSLSDFGDRLLQEAYPNARLFRVAVLHDLGESDILREPLLRRLFSNPTLAASSLLDALADPATAPPFQALLFRLPQPLLFEDALFDSQNLDVQGSYALVAARR